MNKIDLTIDSIILDNVEVIPGRVEHINIQVEAELHHFLEQESLPENLTSGDIPNLDVQTMHLTVPHSDRRLASTMDQEFFSVIAGIKGIHEIVIYA